MSDSKYLNLNRKDSDKNLCYSEIFVRHLPNFDMPMALGRIFVRHVLNFDMPTALGRIQVEF